jgi:hypothetical protein
MGLIFEDISNCDWTRNAPVRVFNKTGDQPPSEFEYTNEMIFRFDLEPSSSNEQVVKLL